MNELLHRLQGELPFIDEAIRPLVVRLNQLGIQTAASCEGHLDGERYPYPWIRLNPFIARFNPEQLAMLGARLAQFVSSHELTWSLRGESLVTPSPETLRRFGVTPAIELEFVDSTRLHEVPVTMADLQMMQQSAQELVEFLH